MIDINNYYTPTETVERAFEIRVNPAEFGDWLIARGRFGEWDSGRSVIEDCIAWHSYEPGRLERLENGGPETIIGLPFRVRATLISEQGHYDSDYRDYTPIQFWLVKRGDWTEVTAVCKPPGAWPETAERLHGVFNWLIDQVASRFGDDFRWIEPGTTAVANQPGAADVGGDGGRATAVAGQPGAGDGAGETAVDEAIRRARIARQYGIHSKTVPMWEEIARLYSAGLPQREIAERVDLSDRTIREHIKNMKARGFLPPENSPK